MATDSLFISLMAESCKKRGFEFEHIIDSLFSCSSNHGNVLFYDQIPYATSLVADQVCTNKWLTKLFLNENNLNNPESMMFNASQKEQAYAWVKYLNCNTAIKPLDSLLGRGVTLDVHTQEKFDSAWENALDYSDRIIVEKMVYGNEYRVFILDGKIIAATWRKPPTIMGDGIHTVQQLIDLKNLSKQNNPFTKKSPIRITEQTLEYLKKQNLTLKSIPPKDLQIPLSQIATVAAGGEHEDMTERIHESFKTIAKNLFDVFPTCSHVGIDLITQDITKSADLQEWYIIEVNSNPSISHHHYPVIGKQRDVAGAVIEHNFNLLQVKLEKTLSFSNIAPIWNQNDENYFDGYLKKNMLYRAARERNLQVKEINNFLWYIENDNKKRHYFHITVCDQTSSVSSTITVYKHITNHFLSSLGIPSPKGKIFPISQKEESWKYAKQFHSCVVKPTNGSGGKDVFTNLKTKKEFFQAISSQEKDNFIVEEFIEGKDYRVLMIDNKFVAAINRIPPFVVGDGIHTLEELIHMKNEKRKENPYTCDNLVEIPSKFSDKLQMILKKDEKLILSNIPNIKAGGESIDVTQEVHVEFQKIICEIMKKLPNLFFAGLDIQASDISKSPFEQKWALIEINDNPDLQMHHFPVHGTKRDVSGVYIDSLFKYNKKFEETILNIIFHGEVTNIEFESWIKNQAYIFAVDGWVKKVDDSSLELLVKGAPNSVEQFILHCLHKYKKAKITNISKKNSNSNITNGFFIQNNGSLN